MNKNNLYRLSALLYHDETNTLNRIKIVSKIIESFLFLNQNEPTSIEILSSKINVAFGILLHDNEITLSIEQSKNFIKKSTGATKKIMLTKKRFEYLKAKDNDNNLYNFINDFYKQSSIKESLLEVTELIERFLFSVFIQNFNKIKTLFNNELKIDLTKLSNNNFKISEKKIINSFLEYKNSKKDKLIFNIASLALEYISLSGNVNLKSEIQTLSNKTFYLDTCIIYRMLGLNGQNRAERMINFLKKCNQVGQKIIISKNTLLEFKNSLENSYSNIESMKNKSINPKLIEEGVEKTYYELKISKKVYTIELFRNFINTKFDKVISELNIDIENENFYKNCKGNERVLIKNTSEDILKFKYYTSDFQAKADAINIEYIKKLRGKNKNSFKEVNYFFLTTDKQLIKWDERNSNHYPLTMYPSDWLNILLRYFSRTDDDYKSFINFIKQVIHEQPMDNNKILAIMDGISEIANGLENQEYIYNKFVEDKYDKIKDINNYNELKKLSKEASKLILEERLDLIEEDFKIEKQANENFRRSLNEKVKVNNNLESKLIKEKDEKKELRRKMKQKAKSDFQKELINYTIFSIVLILIALANIFFQDSPLNAFYYFYKQLNSSNIQYLKYFSEVYYFSPFGLLSYCFYNIYQLLLGNKKLSYRINKI